MSDLDDAIVREIGHITEDGLFIVGISRNGRPIVAPVHLALVTIPILDRVVGVIRTLDALIVGCTLAEEWRHLADRLAAMTVTPEREPGGLETEVRRDGDGWTVFGIVPVFSSPSRRRARAVARDLHGEVSRAQVLQHGRGGVIGGVSSTVRSMELAPGDDLTVGIFKRG